MTSCFVREGVPYSKSTLGHILKEKDDSTLNEIVIKLLEMDYISFKNGKIIFTCVGIVLILDKIIKCYPKYITQNKEPSGELKQILKVLQKHNRKYEQDIYKHSAFDGENPFNMFSSLLFLFEDYYEHGSYTNSKVICEKNGRGEILWDKTINESFTFISNNKPYYGETYQKKVINDNSDYFKRLHDCILTTLTKDFTKMGLLHLFDLTPIDISDEELSSFGDSDYLSYRFERELSRQFVTRKQELLHGLYSYITHRDKFHNSMSIHSFSTKNFEKVWENVCQNVMESKLQEPMVGLGEPFAPYATNAKSTLFNFIENPAWEKIPSLFPWSLVR